MVESHDVPSGEGPVAHVMLFEIVPIDTQMLIKRHPHSGIDSLAIPEVKSRIIEDFIGDIWRNLEFIYAQGPLQLHAIAVPPGINSVDAAQLCAIAITN